MPGQTHPLETSVVEETRDLLLSARQGALEAPDRLREAERGLWSATTEFKKSVFEHQQMTPIEKAGWLIAVDRADEVSDLTADAEVVIGTLKELDGRLRQPGTPVVIYHGPTIADGRELNLLLTSDTGLEIELEPEYRRLHISVGTKERAGYHPTLDNLKPIVLETAEATPQEVDAMDLDHYLNPKEKDYEGRNDFMVIGKEAIVALVERLLTYSSAPDYQSKEAGHASKIWKMAKQFNIRLEKGSSTISKWFRFRKKMIAEHEGEELVKHLGGWGSQDAIELDGAAVEFEVTAEMIKRAAINHHQTSSRKIAAKLDKLKAE